MFLKSLVEPGGTFTKIPLLGCHIVHSNGFVVSWSRYRAGWPETTNS